MEKRCYCVKELQEILSVSRDAVYELLKRREFSWVMISGKYRISKISFDEWLDGGKGFSVGASDVTADLSEEES